MAIKLTVNGQLKEVSEELTLLDLIEKLTNRRVDGCAAALNDNVVPNDEWQQTVLKENDEVALFQIIQGG